MTAIVLFKQSAFMSDYQIKIAHTTIPGQPFFKILVRKRINTLINKLRYFEVKAYHTYDNGDIQVSFATIYV